MRFSVVGRGGENLCDGCDARTAGGCHAQNLVFKQGIAPCDRDEVRKMAKDGLPGRCKTWERTEKKSPDGENLCGQDGNGL